jgi:SAM-dependent methyltransferase
VRRSAIGTDRQYVAVALSGRLAGFAGLVRAHVPPPARVLEVGCGDGGLALALAGAGYAMTAIDPRAPEGAIFRRVRLEELADDGPFDAVVASLSLHHVHDLDAAADRIHALLRPHGLLVLDEFVRERFAGATARWYFDRLETRDPAGFDAWLAAWQAEHDDVHPFGDLRSALDARFVERHLAWTPYLYDYRLGDELEPVERELIDAGAIEPTGCRYVGERR